MQFQILGVILAAVALADVCLGQPQSESATGMEGVISIGQTPPRMIRSDASGPAPLMNAPFVVANETATVASFTTDEQGRFRVLLPPGRYHVSQQDNKSQIRRCGPWDVDVAADKMTKVEWWCETGMRPEAAGDRAPPLSAHER